jgi:lantibiotic biosynthesis protein
MNVKIDENIFLSTEEYLSKNIPDSISLMSGISGLALYYFGRYNATKDEKYYFELEKIFEKLMIELEKPENIYPSFSSGLAGVGWVINYFYKKDIFSKEDTSILDDFDIYLINSTRKLLATSDFDYLHGSSGCILYFLNRIHKKEIIELLEVYIRCLEEQSINLGNNGILFNYFNYSEEVKNYNFSLSHGLASTINILLRLYQKNILRAECKDLIFNAIKGLMLHKNENERSDLYSNIFPSTIDINGNEHRSNQIAWCYGDLGILYTLYFVAIEFDDIDLKVFSLNRLILMSKEHNFKNLKIPDPCVCHGSSGIAYIFFKLYNITGNIIFKLASNIWLEHTLEFYKKDGCFLKRDFDRDKKIVFTLDSSILDGCTSVVQVLNTIQNPFIEDWDEILLLTFKSK